MRQIDSKKCIGCGLCVNDCINQYLQIDLLNGKKIASFKERGRCLNCGHCNAICKQGAISGGELLDLLDDKDDLLSLMSNKRTVRSYIKNGTIAEDKINKIIFAAQTAPTDRNRKSARIVLIKELLPEVYNKALDYRVAEVLKTGTINPLYMPTMRLHENRSEILWNAEYLVIFIGSNKSLIDAAIAAERMQLEAYKLGIGTAYRGDMKDSINNVDSLKALLEIKPNEEVLIAFAMGITKNEYFRPAVKENRKVIFK